MPNIPVRVRFAPSPTGLIHLGSVRTALFNHLFAKQKDGVFILRIEDTDPERNFDPQGKKIIEDLAWLGLNYDEGPGKSSNFGPHLQSERAQIYAESLSELQKKDLVYRCFCSEKLLEQKRNRQVALKKPPRYDGTCQKLSLVDIDTFLKKNDAYIWRFKVNTSKHIIINDLVRGSIEFDLQHFSDFPLTRKNGSFTFMFANAIDDIAMNISHVFRGDDHLSNTANQAQIFQAFDVPLPIFWHMPVICNNNGKKLSKRDFGFSLQDLKNEGFLPEAIVNYLAIIGGSFENEIMSLDKLTSTINFDRMHSSSAIRYDVTKLRWVNQQWIKKVNPEALTQLALPFLQKRYPGAEIKKEEIQPLITIIQPELETIQDATEILQFYFEKPLIALNDLYDQVPKLTVKKTITILQENIDTINDIEKYLETIRYAAKKESLSPKDFFTVTRLMLTGKPKGQSIKDIIAILGTTESIKRLEAFSR